MAPRVKVAGFREGKVLLAVAEKNIDPNALQAEVLDDAVEPIFSDAVNEKNIRVVSQPKVELTSSLFRIPSLNLLQK